MCDLALIGGDISTPPESCIEPEQASNAMRIWYFAVNHMIKQADPVSYADRVAFYTGHHVTVQAQ